MNAQEMIELCSTSNPSFAKLWADICIEGERKEKEWIAALRQTGVKAAHPNDGWVDREKKELFSVTHNLTTVLVLEILWHSAGRLMIQAKPSL